MFENNTSRAAHWILPSKIRKKDQDVKIDSWNFFDQSVKNDTRTYQNIRKAVTGQGDDYTTGCLTIIISKKIIS